MHPYTGGRYSTEPKEDLQVSRVAAEQLVRYTGASQMAPGIYTEQP